MIKQFSILLVAIALLTPTASQAFSGEGEFTKLNDSTLLYIETRSQIALNGDVRLPVAAVPNWMPRKTGNYLKYQILINDQVFAGLDSNAMVLSSAQINDGAYVLPTGETTDFTLFLLLTMPEGTEFTESSNIKLEVTDFPISG